MSTDTTPATPLAKKLTLKPGNRLLIANAPASFRQTLGDLPPDVALTEIADLAALGNARQQACEVIVVFFANRADVEQAATLATRTLKLGGALWLCYPKLSGKSSREAAASDLTRDHGWESMSALGWRPVTQIAIDATWSALRFKPVADVKRC